MMTNLDYLSARELLLSHTVAVLSEQVPLADCAGRVLAQPLRAAESVPPFDRSAYDGYALRAEDTVGAGAEAPVRLTILEEVPAGAVPSKTVSPGTAVKILTGAPLPHGADTVVPFEQTVFTAETVTLHTPLRAGENIVRAGEDVQTGQLLSDTGAVIDPGLLGTLAAQGVSAPEVYRVPLIGILSTGNEVTDAEGPLPPGKIRNSNRLMLTAALHAAGLRPRYLGLAGDSVSEIAACLNAGLADCDAVISTGGVSVGEYDLTPAAMEAIGAELLLRGIAIKPGMACAIGMRDGKLLCGLSGNPASALTTFYAAVLPALRKLAGRRDCVPPSISVTLADPFPKKSPKTRLLRGTLELSDGTARMRLSPAQGNAVLSTMIGCNVMAEIPANSGPLPAGAQLRGWLL